MGLGNTAKKLQRVADVAEKLYQRIDELRTQVNAVREHVERTSTKVEGLERELKEQRAVLDALAREQGIDVDALVAEAAIDEAESASDSVSESAESTEHDADPETPDTENATGTEASEH